MRLQLAHLKETTVLNAGPALAVTASASADSENVQYSVIITLVRRQILKTFSLSDNYLSQAFRCGLYPLVSMEDYPEGLTDGSRNQG
jgi:hypothetical protein